MAGAVGDEWVYVLSQQEAAAAAAERKESNAAADDDQDKEYPADWYTPQEVEIEKAYDAYMAALDRALACNVDDEESEIETEIGRAYEAYVAALDRRAAAKLDGKLETDEELRAYRAACERAAKIIGAGASGNTGGYGAAEQAGLYYYPSYGGGSAPALGFGYEYYDDRCYGYSGFGFPGASPSYGPATGSSSYGHGFGFPGAAYGYGYYGGYAEPYASCPSSYVPAVYLAPPPAFNATAFYSPAPQAMPYVHMSPASYVPPWLHDEPSPPAVAPTM